MSHVPYQHRRSDDPPVETPPPGMTYEQLQLFTEQTERAVRKALTTYSRRAIAGFLVLFVAALANAWYTGEVSDKGRHAVVQSGDVVAVDGCNRDFQDRVAVRGVLIASKDFTQQAARRGTISEDEAQLRLGFYNDRLRELPLPDCRKADDVLTDDPNAPVTIPTPLFPQDTSGFVPPVSSEGAGQHAVP